MNIYSHTGNLYLTINTRLTSISGLLSFSYDQLKRMFNKFNINLILFLTIIIYLICIIVTTNIE